MAGRQRDDLIGMGKKKTVAAHLERVSPLQNGLGEQGFTEGRNIRDRVSPQVRGEGRLVALYCSITSSDQRWTSSGTRRAVKKRIFVIAITARARRRR
jgi:hypothetical protein